MRRILPILALLAATPALAQEVGDARAGRDLAATWCANCHRVAPGGPGPANDAAPTFAAISAMPSTTALSLRAFLQTSHRNMPNFQLTPAQSDNLIAYILSLRAR